MNFRNKKKLLSVFGISLAVWLLFLALVPSLLSKPLLRAVLEKKTGGPVTFETAQLYWFGPQRVTRLSFQKEGLDITIGDLKTKSSLFTLLLRPSHFNQTEITNLSGSYQIHKDAPFFSSSRSKARSSESDQPSFVVFKFPFTGKLTIDKSDFTILSDANEPIQLNEIQLNFSRSDKKSPIFCSLACLSTQNELSGSASLNLEMGGLDAEGKLILTPFDQDLFFLSPEGYLKLNTQFKNLPSIGLDHLATINQSRLQGLFLPALGESIDFGTDLNIVKGKSNIQFKASAPNLSLDCQGTIVQKEFYLDEASHCKYTITPDFIRQVSKQFTVPCEIQASALASIHLDRLTLPLDFKNFNFNALSCNALIEIGDLEFGENDSLSGLSLQQFKGVIDTFDIGENVTFHFKALAKDQNQPATIKLDGQLSKLVDLSAEERLNHLQGNFQLELKDVPSRALTRFSKDSSYYQELLGPKTNMNFKFDGSAQKGHVTFEMQSSRLSIPETHFLVAEGHKAHLMKASPIQYKMNPSFSKLLLHPNLKLLHPIDIESKLKKLDLDFSAPNFIEDIDLKCSLGTFEATYENSSPIELQETKVYFSKNEENELEARAYFSAVLPSELKDLPIGKIFDFSLFFSNFSLRENQEGNLLGHIKSKDFSLNFEGKVDANFTFKLSAPALAKFQPFSKNQWLSNQNSILRIQPFAFSLKHFSLLESGISGEYAYDHLQYKKDSLTAGTLKFHLLPALKKLDLSFSTKDKSQSLVATLNNYSLNQPKNITYQLEGNLKQLPTSLLSHLSFIPNKLLPLLGPRIDLKFEANKKSVEDVYCVYKASNSRLQSEGAFTLSKTLFINEPLHLKYKLGKKALRALHLPELDIQEPTKVHLTVHRLHKDLSSKLPYPEVFEAELSCQSMTLPDGTLKNIQLHAETPNLKDILNIEIIADAQSEKKSGKLKVQGDLVNPLHTKTGHLVYTFNNFPTHLLQALTLAESYEPLLRTLGPSFDATGSLRWVDGPGVLSLNYQSNLAKFASSFTLQDQTLLLNQDLEVELKMADSLINKLAWINPLFKEIKTSKELLHIVIEKENSIIPLNKKLSDACIKGRILPYTFALQDSPTLNPFFDFLDYESSEMDIDVPSQSFEMTDNQIALAPLNLPLDENLNVLLWGTTDLEDQTQNFYFGLPKESLTELFNVPSLPEQALLKIAYNESTTSLQKKRAYFEKKLPHNLTSTEMPYEFIADTNIQTTLIQKEEKKESQNSSSILKQFLEQAKKTILP